MAFTVLYATVAAVCACYVAPLAAGSGISEIKVYLNGVHVKVRPGGGGGAGGPNTRNPSTRNPNDRWNPNDR